MGIRQLHYTWASQGLEGISQFQVVAASPGLANVGDSERRWAIELCSYPGIPAGEQPDVWASIGWLTLKGGRRIAYHRVECGVDGAGRQGNFAAHVLIGDHDELPAARGGILFYGNFWWRGDGTINPKDQVLSELPRQALDAPRIPSVGVDAERALGVLIDGVGTSVGFAETPADAALALALLCEVAPHLLEDRSISTYESREGARHYQLVGKIQGHDSDMRCSRGAMIVARYIARLSDGDRARIGAFIARAGTPWESLKTTLLPFALREQGSLSWDVLQEVARSVDLARELCIYPEGRTALCEGLSRGSQAALSLTGELLTSSDAEFVRMLAAAVSELAIAEAIPELFAILDAAGSAAWSGAADTIERSTDVDTGLIPLGVLAALLERDPRPHRPDLRRDWATRAAELIETTGRTPFFGRGWSDIVEALADGGRWGTLARLCSGPSGAIGAAREGLRSDQWRLMGQAAPPEVLEGLLHETVRGGVAVRSWGRLFWSVAPRVGLPFAWSLLQREGLAIPVPDEEEEGLALSLVRYAAGLEVGEPSLPLVLARYAVALSHATSPQLQRWGRLAAAKARIAPGAPDPWTNDWVPGAQLEAGWAVTRRLSEHSSAATISSWAHQTLSAAALRAPEEATLFRLIAERCERFHNRHGALAAFVAHCILVDGGLQPVSRITGRLKDSEQDKYWRGLADRQGFSHREVMPYFDQTFAPALERWLAGLFGE